MAVGTFIISERPDLGGFKPRGGAARFEWSADRRSAPLQPWSGGVKQRTARTDYPGGDFPTEQVLGPNFKPFSLSGKWLDKYNGERFALDTFEAFLALVRRGNMVQVSFKSMTFIGIITDFDWDYRREYDIGYTFTVSPHRQPGADELAKPPSATVTRDANTLAKEIEEKINLMLEVEDSKPSTQLAGEISPLSTEQVQAMLDASREFNDVVSQRVLVTDADAVLSVRRAVASGDLVIGRAQTKINEASGLKSDTALMYQTAMGVLDFETWNRGLASQARLIVFDSFEARQQLDEQDEPNVIALYKPFRGESLYSVSNRFYGTPDNWRLIKRRNRLASSTLTGSELLAIPEAPAQ